MDPHQAAVAEYAAELLPNAFENTGLVQISVRIERRIETADLLLQVFVNAVLLIVAGTFAVGLSSVTEIAVFVVVRGQLPHDALELLLLRPGHSQKYGVQEVVVDRIGLYAVAYRPAGDHGLAQDGGYRSLDKFELVILQ